MLSRKVIVFFILVALIESTFAATLPLADSAPIGEYANKPTMVNIQVDLEKEGDQDFIYNLLIEIERRGWFVTVYVTGEFATNHPDTVRDIHDRGHQIAVHGWRSGEDLTLLNYDDQLQLLNMSFFAVRSAVGEMRQAYIADFRPQYFKQNVDTFKVLEALNVRSDSGFIASQGDSRPYHTKYGFVAIPISTLYEGCCPEESQGICLCDTHIFIGLQATPEEYLGYLKQKFDQNDVNKEPMVMIVHASVVGKDAEKLDAFVKFLDYVKLKGGEVVLTDYMTTIANPYIENMSVSGPEIAMPGQT
ncbi:MAG: polysaccharide deacetylase family protein, partial [Candidatus Bathyarchaeia archaeon]